ncbi:MAG: rhodanese-like domain-containing protein, partial [Planctomycetes bacterium]|nr:rhodanese-like domain-containing protein [Planctomycetota bacterium]
MSSPTISTRDLHQLLANNKALELIDVRTPVEYREIHVAAAQNVPLDQIDPHAVMQNRKANANEPLYLICRSG